MTGLFGDRGQDGASGEGRVAVLAMEFPEIDTPASWRQP